MVGLEAVLGDLAQAGRQKEGVERVAGLGALGEQLGELGRPVAQLDERERAGRRACRGGVRLGRRLDRSRQRTPPGS